jgi:hypothetical protein
LPIGNYKTGRFTCEDYLPDQLPIPDIAPLLKCSNCGNRRVTVMTNMHEFYALCRARGIGVA